MNDTTAGPWEIRNRNEANEIVAHDGVWTVLTDDDNQHPIYGLRIAGHGQDPYDGDALKVLLVPELAEALVAQFIEETRPYFASLEHRHE